MRCNLGTTRWLETCWLAVGAIGTFAGPYCLAGGIACNQPLGPNLIVGDIQSVVNYTAEQVNGVWHDAAAFGITQCNVGNADSLHQPFPSNQHPASAPSLYKLKDGRIQQIGIGWVHHGFAALSQNTCGCGCNGASGSVIGVGCSNPYTSTGIQASLGPRWQINAWTGTFPTGGPANPPVSGSTARRVRVKSADLEPSSASVKYFAEYQIIAPQEAAFGNQYDNASYRQVSVMGGPNDFTFALNGAIVAGQPAIGAWKASDPDVLETVIQIPGEGRFILAAKATQIGERLWHYEYALANLNSDLSGQAFSIPLPAGAVVSNVGFHDVEYHSGDAMDNFSDPSQNFSSQDWAVDISADAITWSGETYAQNVNANALRWGTMYNFWFDCDKPPAAEPGNITLTTFKVADSYTALSVVPGVLCAADIAPVGGDAQVDVADLLAVINAWGAGAGSPADVNKDGVVNVNDLLAVINAWGACG